jgi:hypothetical protein
MSQVPDLPTMNPYNQALYGFFGEFGAGANTQAYYLQSGVRPSELDKITLISDIKGSERWSVRDLFQRDVDVDRVTAGLLPYLNDTKKVKFFNALTLTLLPVDLVAHQTCLEVDHIEKKEIREEGKDWVVYEVPGLYRFKHMKDFSSFGKLEWNDVNAKVVAIDGQHRLSALKRHWK